MMLDGRVVHECRRCVQQWVDEGEPEIDLTDAQAARVYENARLFQNTWWDRG